MIYVLYLYLQKLNAKNSPWRRWGASLPCMRKLDTQLCPPWTRAKIIAAHVCGVKVLAISGNSKHLSFKKISNKITPKGVPQFCPRLKYIFLCELKTHANLQNPRATPPGIKENHAERDREK